MYLFGCIKPRSTATPASAVAATTAQSIQTEQRAEATAFGAHQSRPTPICASLPTRSSRLERAVRALAGNLGRRSTAVVVVAEQSQAHRRLPPLRSAYELLQRFDTLHSFNGIPENLVGYLKHHANEVRRWLLDVSQPVPLIACSYLNTEAIPDLLAILRNESKRRQAVFLQSSNVANSLNESFMVGAEVYALHRQEKALADLLITRMPVEENHRLLNTEIEDIKRDIERRDAEISTFERAMFRSFKMTQREARDRLSPLPSIGTSRALFSAQPT